MSLNLEEATNLIVTRARQLTNQLFKERGNDNPPFLPEQFAQLLGIKEIVKAELGHAGAVLLRYHYGDIIKVNKSHHPLRQNFSFAHEIGHVLFNELKLETYIRNIEYRTFNPRTHVRARTVARERLCDAAAAELLMPWLIFRKYLSDFGLSIHSVERLSYTFGVSAQAAAIRIAEVSEEPCIALLWQPWLRAKSRVLRLAWCVGPGTKRRGKANYAPVNKIVRHTEKLYKAYKDNITIRSSKLFKLDTVIKRCPLESKGFGDKEIRRVISLALLNS